MLDCSAVESSMVCPKCGYKMVEQPCPGGVMIECWFCMSEATEPPERIYENHCWNCGAAISSRFCKRAQNPSDGYICNICGADLSGWKKERRAV